MSTTPAISVERLTKRFANVVAVRGISFEIAPGQVVGFIGGNGAGKTTTMRIMATLDQPTHGRVRIAGYCVVNHPAAVRQRIGWMPDNFGTYEHMTVAEYLDFFARAYGLKRGERTARMEEVIEFTEVGPLRDRMMSKLSKGQAQRLCLARTLLHDPELLILDEPAAGLDPKARIEFKNLVRLLAERGKTVFISSHILSELGEMCDSLLFIDAGNIVHHGSADALQGETETALYKVRTDGDLAPLRLWAEMEQGVTIVEEIKNGLRLRLDDPAREAGARALRRMIEAGIPVFEFRRERRKLEDAFVDLVGGGPIPPPLPKA